MINEKDTARNFEMIRQHGASFIDSGFAFARFIALF
jgi:hypothetical protein